MNRKILSVFLASLLLLAGVGAAAQLEAVDGSDVGNADNVDTVRLQENSSVDNVTINMTEDQTVSAGGSAFFPTNVTPASINITSQSGSGTASTNIVDDGYYVNETGSSSSVTIGSHEVTFNVSESGNSSGNVTDYINVSSPMDNSSQLAEDPDASETMYMLVYDGQDVLDTDVSVDGPAAGEFDNGSYVPNKTGETARFHFEVSRNNTTYESMPLEDHKFEITLDTLQFSDINEVTNETAGTLELADVREENDSKTYVFEIVDQNNTTRSYDIYINATVESGQTEDALSHASTHDPEGGPSATASTPYTVGAAGSAPFFFDIGDAGLPALVVGGVLVIALVAGLMFSRDDRMGMRGYAAFAGGWKMYGWLLGLVIGLSMAIDYFTSFDFWSNIVVAGLGLPQITPLIVGAAISIAAVGMSYQNSG